MGMFLNAYRENLSHLVKSLGLVHERSGGLHAFQVILRTNACIKEVSAPGVAIDQRPLTGDDVVRREMSDADLLYLPLPFDPSLSLLNRFSLSTKMVSYLAAGKPILYHGPAEAAASRYLAAGEAAIQLNTLDNDVTARELSMVIADSVRRATLGRNGQHLAVQDFNPELLYNRFWSNVLGRRKVGSVVN
jgi:hypothetical protein